MTRASAQELVAGEPEPKKRRVRKGTQSCWQCKHRKVRCTFAAPSRTTCDECRRRGTTCVSQEFHDEPSSSAKVEDRLNRMEATLDRLARNPRLDGSDKEASTNRSSSVTVASDDYSKPGQQAAPFSATPARIIQDWELDPARQLIAAWPNEHDLRLITGLSKSGWEQLELWTCSPYAGKTAPFPQDLLRLPPPGSHPVLIAKKLLLLASFLQGIRAYDPQDAGELALDRRDAIMSCAVDTVRDWVTQNDDLVDSAEGIECLLLESMYHNNAGNLRRAWLVMRRAMLMAQLMGLHRCVETGRPDAGDCSNPNYVWVRLIQMDRYLSLMLGLPIGSTDESFASPAQLEGCSPIERLRRIQCVAAGRILQRNQHTVTANNFTSTNEIDNMLRDAASLMPPKWWLPPRIEGNARTASETFRTMDHLAYYHLLVRLHLPYLLSPCTSGTEHDCNRLTAINASREVLTRFVSFREGSNLTIPYCRGVDFLAFIAILPLCIVHIETRREQLQTHEPSSKSDSGFNRTVFSALAHQRLADRGMMERALEIVEFMARDGSDPIACKIAAILRPLLDIEADAAAGGLYRTTASRESREHELECTADPADGGDALRIYIPYYGAVRIERHSAPGLGEAPMAAKPGLDCRCEDPDGDGELQPSKNSPASYRVGGWSANADWQTVSSGRDAELQLESYGLTATFGASSTAADGYDEQQLLVPGLAATVDDWALQGVDTAFFDSLLYGASEGGRRTENES